MAKNKQRLSDALDNLADTYDSEVGVLEAATDPVAFVDAVAKTLVDLRAERDRSVRIEPADFDGEAGCRFLVGENHVVAEWRGDGVASDNVFAETPQLEYLVTTTAHDRCCRMVLELVHWEVVAAMLRGPGDSKLRPMSERLDDDAELVAIDELTAIDEVLGNGADEQLWPPGLTRAEAVGRLVQDVADAAGELLVPIPEPGTDAAKMLTANVILKRERDKLHNRLADERIIVDGWIEATGATDPVTYKAAEKDTEPSLAELMVREDDRLQIKELEQALATEREGRKTEGEAWAQQCAERAQNVADANNRALDAQSDLADERKHVKELYGSLTRTEAARDDAREQAKRSEEGWAAARAELENDAVIAYNLRVEVERLEQRLGGGK
jgi:hypothetical protein